jgi:L-asparagine oxygenase
MYGDNFPVRKVNAAIATRLMQTARQLAVEYGTVSEPQLAAHVSELADVVASEMGEQCQIPEQGAFVLSGLSVDDAKLGPTPNHWSKVCPERTADWDIMMLLLASVMGRAFAWEGQQEGRVVHNVVSSPGQEQKQNGSSSSVMLMLHNEDAFHPGRAHVMILGCLRNPDRVATHAASIRSIDLDETDRRLLAQPMLRILLDDGYPDVQNDYEAPKITTLWQRGDGMCLRFDPAYTLLEGADETYRAAYHRLNLQLQRMTTPVRFSPGDLLVLDNDVVVHGREPFQARYDGTGRWLKRVNVRVPGRLRPSREADEHGYGQQIIDPYYN